MTDHIESIRKQAEAEISTPQPLSRLLGGSDRGFVDGAVWLASRLDREKIALELAKYDYGENWEVFDAGRKAIAMQFWLRGADAVIELMMKGENDETE